MKTRDGTTGDRDKQGREYLILKQVGVCLLSQVTCVRPEFRQRRPIQEEPYHQSTCHKQQREGEQRIDLTDDLVNRQHRGDDIIAKDDRHPHQGITTDGMQDLCW